MKKIIFILLLTLFFIPGVKADTLTLSSNDYSVYKENRELFEEKANILIDYYNKNFSSEFDYYVINYTSIKDFPLNLYLLPVKEEFEQLDIIYGNGINYGLIFNSYDDIIYVNDSKEVTHVHRISGIFQITYYPLHFSTDLKFDNFSFIYDTNFDLTYDYHYIKESLALDNYNYYFDEILVSNFYNNSIISIKDGEKIPTIRELLKYDSYEDYYANQTGLTEVNLDNYEYVILNLKNYNQDIFDTNLQVKGMIGITPVYEFGTVEKETITDRCNVSYSDYTSYRLYILENDLINNAVYYVKACQEGSSFKFDSSIFDITYVTADNVNDPVITFGGVEYHTIPFDKLSNSANQNESNNFIPGATDNFKPFEGVADYVSNFWNSLTTFMSLVTKFFNTLPIEIRAISITGFFTAITLGVIKFIKS